jgi:ribosomal protein L12E/L44/L45/RPP1/RPP2
VPTLKLVPIAELVEQLRANPLACSVIEFNGSNHFDPWLLKPSLRAAAIAAAASANAKADASNDAAAETGEEVEEDVEQEEDEPMPAALVDDEWVEMPGGPWTARLMRKARQTAAPPGFRVFGVNVTFSPATPIYAGGAVKFRAVGDRRRRRRMEPDARHGIGPSGARGACGMVRRRRRRLVDGSALHAARIGGAGRRLSARRAENNGEPARARGAPASSNNVAWSPLNTPTKWHRPTSTRRRAATKQPRTPTASAGLRTTKSRNRSFPRKLV